MKQTHFIGFLILLLAVTNIYADSHETDSNIMKADTNNDGKVTFEEYKAANEESMRKRFEGKDINNDGSVDLKEKKVEEVKKQEQYLEEKETETQQLREKYAEDRKKRKKHFYKYQ